MARKIYGLHKIFPYQPSLTTREELLKKKSEKDLKRGYEFALADKLALQNYPAQFAYDCYLREMQRRGLEVSV